MHPTAGDTIADITHNAFESGASMVELDVKRTKDNLQVDIRDNGCGMSKEALQRALDPFWSDPGKHPGRKVGLGLPFLKQAVEQSGGKLYIDSAPGQGTQVSFSFDLRNVDAPPMGDLATTLTGLMAFPGDREFIVRRAEDDRAYDVRRSELAAAVGGFESAGSLALVKEFFASNEEAIVRI